jgi:hypothetical protein
MYRMYRISRFGKEPVADAQISEEIKPAIGNAEPGLYLVHEISAEPLPSGNVCRPWGIGVKRQNGSVEFDRGGVPFAQAIPGVRREAFVGVVAT